VVTVDETIRRIAPDIVKACDELERLVDHEISRMRGPASCARVAVGGDVDTRMLHAIRRKYERAGWDARAVHAAHGGFDIEIRMMVVDQIALLPIG
jgi:hypothetical protein